MAVPKKKVSKSRRNNRRGGNGTYKLKFPNVVENKTTGEFQLPHHVSLDGYYNGNKVVENEVKEEVKEEKEEKVSE